MSEVGVLLAAVVGGVVGVAVGMLLTRLIRRILAPRSVRAPLVALGCAVFFGLVAVCFGPAIIAADGWADVAGAILAAVAFLYLAAISLALAIIDVAVHRLPNVIVLPGYVVGAVLLGAASALTGDGAALLRAAIGCVTLGVLYLVLALAHPGGMGLGDVKLAGVLGLFLGWLGWEQLAVGAFLAFFLGGLFALAVLALRRGGRRDAVPFGPWMLAGAWLGVFVGSPVADGYISLFAVA